MTFNGEKTLSLLANFGDDTEIVALADPEYGDVESIEMTSADLKVLLTAQVHTYGWFVKDFADGWIYFDDKAEADRHVESTAAMMLAGVAGHSAPMQLPLTPVTLTYSNWRGETAERTIIPKAIWYGSTEWHPEAQWLLRAIDTEKGAERDFALKDFGAPTATGPVAVQPLEWVKTAHDDRHNFIAKTILGNWEAWQFLGNGAVYVMTPGEYQGRYFVGTLVAAKAHLESDYRARIAPALATPSGEAEIPVSCLVSLPDGFSRSEIQDMLSIYADEEQTVDVGFGPQESTYGWLTRLFRALLATAPPAKPVAWFKPTEISWLQDVIPDPGEVDACTITAFLKKTTEASIPLFTAPSTDREGRSIAHGMILAATIAAHGHGKDTLAVEILAAAGITSENDLRKFGVDEFDLKALSRLFNTEPRT